MPSYDAVKDLPLEIDGYDLEPLEQEVDYNPVVQEQFQARRGELPVVGEHTLDAFSLLQSGQTEYRRWGLESAALELTSQPGFRS